MGRTSYTHEELAADLKADLDAKQINEKFWKRCDEKFHPADLDASLLKSSGDLQDAGDWTTAGDGLTYPGEAVGLPENEAIPEPEPVVEPSPEPAAEPIAAEPTETPAEGATDAAVSQV